MRRVLPPVAADLVVTAVVGSFAVGNALHDGGRLWLTVPVTVLGSAALLLRSTPAARSAGARDSADGCPRARRRHLWLYPAVLFALYSVAQQAPRRLALRVDVGTFAGLAVARPDRAA